jgi:DNA adenine methylase
MPAMQSHDDQGVDRDASEENAKIIPFLKWPGGKRWLVDTYPNIFPADYGIYIEPFLGAGSVYFHLKPARAILGDLNGDLVSVYRGIKEDAAAVKELLEKHHAYHCKEYYYEMREFLPTSLATQAARIIYLNRTCFNGIYRVNRKGQFNVPIGERREVVRDTDDFDAVAKLLMDAEIRQEDFEILVNLADSGDLVFLDPPYTVRHNKNGFIKYNEHLFSWDDQERLATAATHACERGAHVVVTNASHPTVRNLYSEELFTFRQVSRYSSISASAESRKHFDELIISSREVGGSHEARHLL